MGWPLVRNDNRAIGQLAAQPPDRTRIQTVCLLRARRARVVGPKTLRLPTIPRRSGPYVPGIRENPTRGAHPLAPLAERRHGRGTGWLKGLPKPIGLFTCNDLIGLQAINLCREAGLNVPREVSVIGVDNDEIGVPARGARAIDRRSEHGPDRLQVGGDSRPLDAWGAIAPREIVLVRPLGVVTRESTEIAAALDPRLGQFPGVHQEVRLRPRSAWKTLVRRSGVSRSLLQQIFAARWAAPFTK